jgi:cell division protein FtsI (penicillin-binding protein 3)
MAIVVAFGFLLFKLGNIQTVDADRFVSQAKMQRERTEVLPATRGVIVDRNGDPLVTTETRKTIYTDPANVVPGRAPEIAAALAPLLGVPAVELQEALEADSNFRYLGRKLTDSVAAQVMAFGFEGVYALDEPTRLKPAGDLALGVLGSVDTENIGISGVERSFDTTLTGVPGEIRRERSLDGDHTIPSGRQTMVPATPGSTVMLTLDRNLQQVAEKAVADQVAALAARAGIAVVMDRATGEILAMASVARDSTTGATYNDAQNRAITTTFDPGSVMKAVTMSSAIEAGVVSSGTVRRVPPKLDIYEETFVDDSRFQDEDMTVTQILARSSNIGTIEIAQQMGEERLMDGIGDFGFGATTRIGLEQEETGIVPDRDGEDWSALSLPTLAIGQGITATPLQVVAAYNTIANDGEYVSPLLVRSIVSPDSHDATRMVADRRRVVSPDTAEQVRSMLSAVVGAGTGTKAQVPGYNVAGKTGTAWKARASGGYGSDGDRDYLATFVGFAPVDNPRFSIIVTIDEPRTGAITGGAAAAPVFSVIARQALLSYDVPPDAPGWAQPADGTNLRARPAEAPALPDPVVRMTLTPPVPTGTAAVPDVPSPAAAGPVTAAGGAVTATTRPRQPGGGP